MKFSITLHDREPFYFNCLECELPLFEELGRHMGRCGVCEKARVKLERRHFKSDIEHDRRNAFIRQAFGGSIELKEQRHG
jgi:uncharacterized Zn finger protein (UPF0148 family)